MSAVMSTVPEFSSARLSSVVQALRSDVQKKRQLEERINRSKEGVEDNLRREADLRSAYDLLGTVQEEAVSKGIQHVMNGVNTVLARIFPNDEYRVSLEHELYRDKHHHVNLYLSENGSPALDLVHSTGNGIRNIIAFLMRLLLVEISGGRKLLVMDELLQGISEHNKRIMYDIMKLSVANGWQFLVIEHQFPDVPNTVLVNRRDGKSYVESVDVDSLKAMAQEQGFSSVGDMLSAPSKGINS